MSADSLEPETMEDCIIFEPPNIEKTHSRKPSFDSRASASIPSGVPSLDVSKLLSY